MADPFVLDRRGFEVLGTRRGGWVVMMRSSGDGDDYGRRWQFTAAFTTFAELVEWLAKQPRVDSEETVTNG